jgi:hypothetical protein
MSGPSKAAIAFFASASVTRARVATLPTAAKGQNPVSSIAAINVIQTMRVGVGSSHTEESRIFVKILLYMSIAIVTHNALQFASKFLPRHQRGGGLLHIPLVAFTGTVQAGALSVISALTLGSQANRRLRSGFSPCSLSAISACLSER